jgi:hypothetical protein
MTAEELIKNFIYQVFLFIGIHSVISNYAISQKLCFWQIQCSIQYIHFILKKFYKWFISLQIFFFQKSQFLYRITIRRLIHCRNQDFRVEGPKKFFFVTNEFNCIKIDNNAIFNYNDFLRANCTSHWFDKFEYIDSFIVSLGIEIEMHKKCIFITFLL